MKNRVESMWTEKPRGRGSVSSTASTAGRSIGVRFHCKSVKEKRIEGKAHLLDASYQTKGI